MLASDWGMSSYPKWMTVCTEQHVRYDGNYLVASFCAQAMGAGDARGWQIQMNKGWMPLPKW